ncbi:hypothetical protein ACX0G9_23270 [Flavitalea flava]
MQYKNICPFSISAFIPLIFYHLSMFGLFFPDTFAESILIMKNTERGQTSDTLDIQQFYEKLGFYLTQPKHMVHENWAIGISEIFLCCENPKSYVSK